MSYQSDNLDLEILEVGDPADLTTISDNFDKIDAVVGDIATFETSPTKAAHSAGEFLLYEGRLYKVTAAISAGGSLILGTNVQVANIGSEIKSLLDSVGRWNTSTFRRISADWATDHIDIEFRLTDGTSRYFVINDTGISYHKYVNGTFTRLWTK